MKLGDGFLRSIMQELEKQGWRVEKRKNGGWALHPSDTSHSPVFSSATFHDWRGIKNFLAELKRRGFKLSSSLERSVSEAADVNSTAARGPEKPKTEDVALEPLPFGAALRQAREGQHLSQADLASMMGVQVGTVAAWESTGSPGLGRYSDLLQLFPELQGARKPTALAQRTPSCERRPVRRVKLAAEASKVSTAFRMIADLRKNRDAILPMLRGAADAGMSIRDLLSVLE